MLLNEVEEGILKKEILRQLLHNEIGILKASPGLDVLENQTILLRFLFRKFLLEFPFFKKCPDSFWKDVDSFVKKIHSCNISSSEERGKLTELDIWINRLEKVGVILFRNFFQTNVVVVENKNKPDTSSPQEKEEQDSTNILKEVNLKEEDSEGRSTPSTMTPIFLSPLSSPLSSWKPKKQLQDEEASLAQEYMKIFKEFMNRLLYSGEILKLFDLIKSVDKVEDLPTDYQVLLNGSYKVMAFYLLKKYHKDESASKSKASLKLMYNMFPFFGIKALLKFSNPLRIVRGMVDLFLAKPFGNRNLAQQFVGIWMESHDKEMSLIEDRNDNKNSPSNNKKPGKQYYQMSRKKLVQLISNSLIVEKITNYVNRDDSLRQLDEQIQLPINKLQKITLILKYPVVPPLLSASVIDSISDEKLVMIYQLYRKETRVRDYVQVKKLLADDEIIHTIKETVGTFCEPLMKLYKQADVGIVISKVKDLLKDWINLQSSSPTSSSLPSSSSSKNNNATSSKKMEIEEIDIDEDPKGATTNSFLKNNQDISHEDNLLYQQYTETLEKFGKGIYQFFHETAQKDDGLVQSLIVWFVGQMDYFQKDSNSDVKFLSKKPVIDLKFILKQHIKTKEQKLFLAQELKQLNAFYEERRTEISKRIKLMLNQGAVSKDSAERP